MEVFIGIIIVFCVIATPVLGIKLLKKGKQQKQIVKELEAFLTAEDVPIRSSSDRNAYIHQLILCINHKEERLNKEFELREHQYQAKIALYAPYQHIIDAEMEAQRITEQARAKFEKLSKDANEFQNKITELRQMEGALYRSIYGYGEEYILSTYRLLEEYAKNNPSEASLKLKEAIRASKSLIKSGSAVIFQKNCTEAVQKARTTAILGWFNAQVDAIINKQKDENYGIVSQKVKDLFCVVNGAFELICLTTISEQYLNARLNELKLYTVVCELKRKEREEQQQIKEQMREEAKRQKELEKAKREAEKEQTAIRKALEKAEAEQAKALANAEAKHEKDLLALKEQLQLAEEQKRQAMFLEQQNINNQQKLQELAREKERAEREHALLMEKMKEAETQHQMEMNEFKAQSDAEKADMLRQIEASKRAISNAQQTRFGHVYVISNVGSFEHNADLESEQLFHPEHEHVFKVGMTRRFDPMERVKELGDASVPFSFDVHAMIESDDAPALETMLHKKLAFAQVNRINSRKEFFRLSLTRLKSIIEECGVKTQWTMVAAAQEYRDSLSISKDPEEMKKWEKREVFKYDSYSDDSEED